MWRFIFVEMPVARPNSKLSSVGRSTFVIDYPLTPTSEFATSITGQRDLSMAYIFQVILLQTGSFYFGTSLTARLEPLLPVDNAFSTHPRTTMT